VAVQPDAAAGRLGAPATAVAIDGAWLSAAALSTLPAEERDAIKAARKAQLLRALRACVVHRWAGGFAMLRKCAAQLLSIAANIAVETLAAHIVLARAGGRVTDQLMAIRTGMAELLESAGRHREAVGLYLLNLASQHDLNQRYDPSQSWVNLGCALSELGDLGAAEQALEKALLALDAPVPAGRRETPWWRRPSSDPAARESHRLRLLWLILHTLRKRVALAGTAGGDDADAAAATQARFNAAALRMFRRHVLQHAGEVATEESEARVSFSDDGVCMELTTTGTRFLLRLAFDAATGDERRWVERVRKGAPLPPCLNAAEVTRRAQQEARGHAQFIVDGQRQGHKLPPLPAQCAQCGASAAAMKRCGGCAAVVYCSAACGEAHWRAGHKEACRRDAA
jgi:hypothetical protein